MSLGRETTIGAFVITSPLGAGSMGEVYRARDTKLDRDVAVKVLPESSASDPDRLTRFEREAKTLAALNHPHLGQVHRLQDAGTTRALIMEQVEGDDLTQRIARGPISLDEALPNARQIAEALEAAHDAGIIHRDPKPVATPGFEATGKVSVAGRGIAYQSINSGEHHIYVRPFRSPGAPVRVSVGPGAIPQWGGDGRELFWQAPHAQDSTATVLYSAEQRLTGSSVRSSVPKLVLPPHLRFAALIDNCRYWAAAPDGQHFLLRQADGLPGAAVKVILNWPALLGGH